MNKAAGFIILLAGILWGVLGIFVRELSAASLGSLQIAFLRAALGAILLVIGVFVKDRSMLKIRLKDFWCFFGTGIVGFTFFNYCYFTTIQYTSLSVAAVLLYTAPSIVIIFSAILFREQITLKKVIALLLAFAGCLCTTGIFAGDAVLNARGLLTGFGAGFGYAMVTVFTRYALNRNYHSLTIVVYTLIFASFGTCVLTDAGAVFQYVFSGSGAFLLSLLFALVSTILPYLFYTWGLSRVENGKATIIVSIEPIAATIVGALVFGEELGFYGFLGIILMFVSLIVLNLTWKNGKLPNWI